MEVANRTGYLAHWGVHFTGDNAGDVVLYDAVQRLFMHFFPGIEFRSLALRKSPKAGLLDSIKQNALGAVVGGGGLIFPVSDDKSVSGWQWNISKTEMNRLSVPLILFGVGVNTFRGQSEFSDAAKEHLQATCEQAAFIGMRNRGSISKMASLLPDIDANKFIFQPCPTTVLSYFSGHELAPRRLNKVPVVGINAALDRAELRFPGPASDTLNEIAIAAKFLRESGVEICVITHSERDDELLTYMRRQGIAFTRKRLERCLPQHVCEFYGQIDLTIGMRGHSQMIPFGCGKAILSVATHDKLGFFLEDIGHPDWCIDARESDLAAKIFKTSRDLIDNLPDVEGEIHAARQNLWNITTQNMIKIGSALNLEIDPKLLQVSRN